ncbi:MAG TPA: hypothetical protein VNZ06_11975, partial [Steroidobacteraceae bacterium]|nr:hypothetical protein [Steroidobacteraceae bacterium]
SIRAPYGCEIEETRCPVFTCLKRAHENFHVLPKAGCGIGCFRRRRCRMILDPDCVGGIINMSRV